MAIQANYQDTSVMTQNFQMTQNYAEKYECESDVKTLQGI